ncbi:hypothetical protein RJ639_006258 [Escallonia herrerae]|uniref:RNase H type-1 domain-containing protein n=1 Tax=Escallonia herrerae TaxID=1293975 RepID=A0AA88VX31_9ASTE|nr:hypothetical protein RJ639_006258 [Escallonia herrerae]
MVPRDHRPERSPPKEETGYPLSEAIEKAKLPPNFQMPQCDHYDGTRDRGEHVYQFETNMLLLQVSDVVMCRAFPTTLRKAAHAWYKSLQSRFIHSFAQLSDLFQKHFVSSHSRRKNSASLQNAVQEKNESLTCFLGRFNAATLEIDNLVESVKYISFLCGLQSTTKFAFSMNKSHPGNMKALLEKANKYIQAEEYVETHSTQRTAGRMEGRTEETVSGINSPRRKAKDEHSNGLSSKDGSAVYGFSNHSVAVEGIIAFVVAIRTPPTQANLMLDFVVVKPRDNDKTVRIGSNLKDDTKLELVNLLRTYEDVFAWTAADMPGIDPKVITRRLNCTLPEDPPQLVISEVTDPWNLYVDGSSAVGSSGAGIILTSPEGFTIEYALRFGFQASNNEAEYEALLPGIRLAHALKVDSLSVHSDSQ